MARFRSGKEASVEVVNDANGVWALITVDGERVMSIRCTSQLQVLEPDNMNVYLVAENKRKELERNG